jgi:hypothetical protein
MNKAVAEMGGASRLRPPPSPAWMGGGPAQRHLAFHWNQWVKRAAASRPRCELVAISELPSTDLSDRVSITLSKGAAGSWGFAANSFCCERDLTSDTASRLTTVSPRAGTDAERPTIINHFNLDSGGLATARAGMMSCPSGLVKEREIKKCPGGARSRPDAVPFRCIRMPSGPANGRPSRTELSLHASPPVQPRPRSRRRNLRATPRRPLLCGLLEGVRSKTGSPRWPRIRRWLVWLSWHAERTPVCCRDRAVAATRVVLKFSFHFAVSPSFHREEISVAWHQVPFPSFC